MKDEVAGCPIAEFVGLRPKMYSFEAVRTNPDGATERFDKHRVKGIKRAVNSSSRVVELINSTTRTRTTH